MTATPTLLVTVDSLRYDHYDHMPETKSALGESHPATFATSTATAGSFQSIIGGYYPDGGGLNPGTSVASEMSTEKKIAVSTNHLLSERYDYDAGFDWFTAPAPTDEGLKGRVQRALTPESLPHKIAVTGYNLFLKLRSQVSSGDMGREYRPAAAVIDEFLEAINGCDDWFGWLHFMEPHHPYNPAAGPVDRERAQAVSRRVLAGNGRQDDQRLVRELYRAEIEELDAELGRLWETLDNETRVVFCADHGECLGEDGTWGHPGELRLETLHVPLATRNVPDVGNLVSLVDVPSLLLGSIHGEGSFDRDVAFATYGNQKAAIDTTHIKTSDGITTHDGSPAENSSLDRAYARFSSSGFVKEDAAIEDLEALGYL